MPEFRKKPVVIHAEQFTDEASPPAGVRQIGASYFYVITIQGAKVRVKPGEWIIRESDGVHYYPCADVEFTRLYEPGDAPVGFAKVFGSGMDQVLVTAEQDEDNEWTIRFEVQIEEGIRMAANLFFEDEDATKVALGKVTDEMAFKKRDALKAEFVRMTGGSAV